MIEGRVTDSFDAMVPLRIRSVAGVEREVEAVLDTGFNDFLTLPIALIRELGLPRAGETKIKQSDGEEVLTELYMVSVLWQGQQLLVPAQAGGETLVGMRLLYDNLVTLQVRFGGRVAIELLV